MSKWLLYTIKIKDKKWKSLNLLKLVKVHLKSKINID